MFSFKNKKIQSFLISPPNIVISTFVSIALIASVDYLSNKDLNFFIWFLLPCSLAAWYYKNGSLAVISAFVAISMTFISDIMLKPSVSIGILGINAIFRFVVFLMFILLIRKTKLLTISLEKLTLIDMLSSVGNKRAFLARGAEEILRMHRSGLPMSLAFLDVDNFKSVNDNYGHKEGDFLITQVGKILKKNIRDSDFVSRMGGDEFAIIFFDTDADGAKIVMKKIHQELELYFSKYRTNVSSSIGIATFLKPPKNIFDALEIADKLMYQVKNSTKNSILQKTVEVGELK